MTPAAPPVPASWMRLGRLGLGALLLVAVAASVALAFESPVYALVVPGLLIGGGMLSAMSRFPLGQLCGVMVLFGVTARLKEGLQVEEVVYAVYYLSYLGSWFATRLWVYRERVFDTPLDIALGLFLAYMTASLGLTVLFGGSLSLARGDWIALSAFAFYFPIKEACARYRWGPWVVIGIVIYLGLFSFIRNLLTFSAAIQDAEYAWQIARGRVPMNEMLLFVPALGCLGFAARASGWTTRIVLTGGFALFSVGVILTQWRAYYVDLAFGVMLFVLLLEWRGRGRLVVLVGLSGLLGMGLGYLLFPGAMELIVVGIFDRILSIGTASTADVSLLNRFLESRSAWELIKQNPIAGYGIGTTFGFFDTIYNATWVKSYIHNGYLLLWFKFGIVGLLLVLFAWARAILAAHRVWRRREIADWERTLGLTVAIILISLIPSHFVWAPFTTSDTVLTFALLMGTAAGLAKRVGDPSAAPTATDGTREAGGRAPRADAA